jgi:hypothetical protein
VCELPGFDIADPVVGKLRCPKCGKEIECHEREGVQFAVQHAWPLCCGEIMLLLITMATQSADYLILS